MRPEEELARFDRERSWNAVYQKLRMDCLKKHDYSLKDSRRPEFRNRNRYGDVSPYDYTRVHLQRNSIDYINANIVKAEAANRTYLLTQGPLPETSGHFWLMVWEQGSKAVLMLNRVIEKGQIKCHQYYPVGRVNQGVDEMIFNDVGLKVTYLTERHTNYHYTARILELQDLETLEKREVTQFHYTAWPDFGVPESPDAFLEFLSAVRQSGVLDDPGKPPVIHCSAGIGRSGTFCIVDTCLVLIEKQKTTENINMMEVLMDMRRYRMGLIQTADQLRFSYVAVVAGARQSGYAITTNNSEGAEGVTSNLNNSSSESPQIYDERSSSPEYDEDSEFEEEEEGEWPDEPPPIPPRQIRPPPPPTPPEDQCSPPPQHPGQLSAAIAVALPQINAGLYQNVNTGADKCNNVNNAVQTQNTNTASNTAAAAGVVVNGNRQQFVSSPFSRKLGDEEESRGQEEVLRKHSQEREIRRRIRDERIKQTADQVARMRVRQQEAERALVRQRRYGPYIYTGIAVAVAVAGVVLYRTFAG